MSAELLNRCVCIWSVPPPYPKSQPIRGEDGFRAVHPYILPCQNPAASITQFHALAIFDCYGLPIRTIDLHIITFPILCIGNTAGDLGLDVDVPKRDVFDGG